MMHEQKWKWSTATIRESFLRMTQQKERQWGYERTVTEENGEADQLQGSKRINSRNQTGVSESRNSIFCENPNNHSSHNLFCRYTVGKLHKIFILVLTRSSNCSSSAEEIDVHAQGIDMWIAVQQGLRSKMPRGDI